MNRRTGYVLVAIGALLAFAVPPLLSAVAQAAPSTPVYKQETGLAATTACTALAANAGADLTNATGWRAIASSPSSTFTGGAANCCFRSTKVARWMPCNAAFNIALVSGQQDVPGPDVETYIGAGRVAYVGAGVTQASGTTFTMTYEVAQR